MCRLRLSAVAFLFLSLLLMGCSSPVNRYKMEYKKGLKALHELHFTLKKSKNANGEWKISGSDIKEINERLVDIRKLIDETEPQDEKLKEQVLKRYSPMLEAILANIDAVKKEMAQSKKVEFSGGGSETLKQSDTICKTYEALTRPEKDKAVKKN
jgi:hypothetical protein